LISCLLLIVVVVVVVVVFGRGKIWYKQRE